MVLPSNEFRQGLKDEMDFLFQEKRKRIWEIWFQAD